MATPVEVLLFGDTCHAWRLKPIATSFYIRIVLFSCIQKPAEVAKIIELDVIKKIQSSNVELFNLKRDLELETDTI